MKIQHNVTSQNGNAMIIVLLIMALLTFVGVATTTFTTTEMETAANDMRSKRAFYIADGATEVASELLEQNINCPSGFTSGSIGGVEVVDLDFWLNSVPSDPSDSDRDLHFPVNDAVPHTNVNIGESATIYNKGGSSIMSAGYERSPGKTAAAAGASKLYDIVARHEGDLNTASLIRVEWRHVIKMQGNCEY
jgi:hypothetical protein